MPQAEPDIFFKFSAKKTGLFLMNRDNLLNVWILLIVLSSTDFQFRKQIEFNAIIKQKCREKQAMVNYRNLRNFDSYLNYLNVNIS